MRALYSLSLVVGVVGFSAVAIADDFGIQIVPRTVPIAVAQNEGGPQPPAKPEEAVETLPDPAGGETEATTEAAPDSDLPVIVPQDVHSPSYTAVYNSIPFNRAEYEANASYRHDATMEIMFGELRDTVIYKTNPSPSPSYPFDTLNLNWYRPVTANYGAYTYGFGYGPYSRIRTNLWYQGSFPANSFYRW